MNELGEYLAGGQNPLEVLPDNVIRNICSDLDDVSLVNLSKKYKRVNIVCSRELALRKKLKSVSGSVDVSGVFRILDKRQFRGKIYGKPCTSHTIAELKSLCEYLNLSTSGSRKDLCDRLREALMFNVHEPISVREPIPILEPIPQPSYEPIPILEPIPEPEIPIENYTEQDLNRMTVVQLRQLLKSNGLKVPRLKADMVKVLYLSGIRKLQPIYYKKEELKTEEPRKESPKKEPKKELRTKCDSPYDFITLESWDESPPDVFINFISGGGKPNVMKCYQSETLKQWLSDTGNTFAKWVQILDYIPMDDTGRNGEPDLKNTFVKLYTGEFLVYDQNVQDLIDGNKNIILDVVPQGVERIGNLRGTRAMSEHHGQLPGYQVYKIIRMYPAANI